MKRKRDDEDTCLQPIIKESRKGVVHAFVEECDSARYLEPDGNFYPWRLSELQAERIAIIFHPGAFRVESEALLRALQHQVAFLKNSATCVIALVAPDSCFAQKAWIDRLGVEISSPLMFVEDFKFQLRRQFKSDWTSEGLVLATLSPELEMSEKEVFPLTMEAIERLINRLTVFLNSPLE